MAGGGYFALIVQVSNDELRPLTIALGNTVRFACEFLLSLLLIGASGRLGLGTVIGGFALISGACALLFAHLLPEVNVRHQKGGDTTRGSDML